MPSNDEILLKSDKGKKLESSPKFALAQKMIADICNDLSQSTDTYKPAGTIKLINAYLKDSNKIGRVLYSEISSFVFSLGPNQREELSANTENLMVHALEANERRVGNECKDVVIRIYDHCQLAVNQMQGANMIFASQIQQTKMRLTKEIKQEIKQYEREYITILGIFASIVLAFVGGMTYSTSVLQYMKDVSIYRLLAVADVIAFVLLNTIQMLISLIFNINNRDCDKKYFWFINGVCIVFGVALFICYIKEICL